jgi:hypothetical protein
LTQHDSRSLEEFVHECGLRTCFDFGCGVASAAVCGSETTTTVLAIDQPPEEQNANPEVPATDRTTLMVADGIFSLSHGVFPGSVRGVVPGVLVRVIHLAFLPVGSQLAFRWR